MCGLMIPRWGRDWAGSLKVEASMNEVALLVIGGAGLFLVLPIVTVVLLAKLLRAHRTGLDDVKRELRGLRLEVKGWQTAAPRRAPGEPSPEPVKKPEIVPSAPPKPEEVPAQPFCLET